MNIYRFVMYSVGSCEGKPGVYCNYLVPMYKDNQAGERKERGCISLVKYPRKEGATIVAGATTVEGGNETIKVRRQS